MEFKRPANLQFPQIYESFAAGGDEFFISELTEDKSEEAWELIAKSLVPEETFCRSKQIMKNAYAMNFLHEGNLALFKQRNSLACYKKANNELVGLNVLGVKTRGIDIKRNVSLFLRDILELR